MLSKARRVLLYPGTHPGIQLTRKLCTLNPPTPYTSRTSPSTKERNLITSEAASSLYRRLAALNHKSGCVNQMLNEWISTQGKSFNNNDILASVDYLRKFKKFDHALQLLEWAEKRGLLFLKCREHAICIVLIWKTRGLEAAEKYFFTLPDSAKKRSTYGALLHCFCCEKMTDKAMALSEKMQVLNFPKTSFEYSSLMCLLIKLGQADKVPLLEQEMKEKGIKPHLFAYNLLINAYSSLKDIKEVERVVEEIKMSNGVTPDWQFYSNLAAIYIEAGLTEKAELTLKEIEKLKMYDPRAFHFLLNLYTSLGKAEEVNRVWESLKVVFPKPRNLSYLTRLQTLFRLGDMDGIKTCFEEWESSCSYYDVRLAFVLIKSYIKRDMIDEAKSVLYLILEKGYELNFATYALFADYFVEKREKDLAHKFLEIGTPHVWKYEKGLHQNVKERVLNLLRGSDNND